MTHGWLKFLGGDGTAKRAPNWRRLLPVQYSGYVTIFLRPNATPYFGQLERKQNEKNTIL